MKVQFFILLLIYTPTFFWRNGSMSPDGTLGTTAKKRWWPAYPTHHCLVNIVMRCLKVLLPLFHESASSGNLLILMTQHIRILLIHLATQTAHSSPHLWFTWRKYYYLLNKLSCPLILIRLNNLTYRAKAKTDKKQKTAPSRVVEASE